MRQGFVTHQLHLFTDHGTVLFCHLFIHTVFDGCGQFLFAHGIDVSFDFFGIHVHLFGICLNRKLLELFFRIHRKHTGNLCFQSDFGFNIDIEGSFLFCGKCGEIRLDELNRFFFGKLILVCFEGKTADDIFIGICELFLYEFTICHTVDHVFGQRGRITDGARHHGSNAVFIGADDTHDLQVDGVFGIVKKFNACLNLTEIGISTVCCFLIKIGREDHLEGHAEDFLVRPAFCGCVFQLTLHGILNFLLHFFRCFKTERVENKVADFVVFVNDQNDFVISLRPRTVKQIVLIIEEIVQNRSV